jgi:hypothetical protein
MGSSTSPLTARPLSSRCLLRLHATPTQPRRRHAWLRTRIIVLAFPHPTPSTIRIRIAAELRKIRSLALALSAPLGAAHTSPLHSPSPEHTRSLWTTVSDKL